MASPFHLAITGTFVIVGKEPDGDSVRFVADTPALYRQLRNAHRVRPSNADGSVPLRFEAIDAPELHYGTAAQPLGVESRDHLLERMGFDRATIAYAASQPTRVTAADPATVRGAILTKAAEVNGRPVSYVVVGRDADTLVDGTWTEVDAALLRRTLNFWSLDQGDAYYTVYSSTPLTHRQLLREVATAARDARRGVWALDRTANFVLESPASISPVDPAFANPDEGQLILPKLFRRSIDYLKAVAKGFEGNLVDWLLANESTPSRSENDRVVLDEHLELRLSDLLQQQNRHVVFQADPLAIVFVEK